MQAVNVGELIGLSTFKMLVKEDLISEFEYKNMTKEFQKNIQKPLK